MNIGHLMTFHIKPLTKPEAVIPQKNLYEIQALCKSTPQGALVEVGVFRGGSAWVINEVANGRQLHLFDTFSGIPERTPDIDQINLGAFADTSAKAVQEAFPNAKLHIGIFPDTLPDDLTDIAFAHIDCDQYQTCKSAIELLWPRMVSGGVMAFDDYQFIGIKKAIHDYFGIQNMQFTELSIPYKRK